METTPGEILTEPAEPIETAIGSKATWRIGDKEVVEINIAHPGDVLIFEFPCGMLPETVARIKKEVVEVSGCTAIVLSGGGRFAGIVRAKDNG